MMLIGIGIALLSWALAALFGWKTYQAVVTGHMSVGALPAFNFTREQRPVHFWWFAVMFALMTVIMAYAGLGAMIDTLSM